MIDHDHDGSTRRVPVEGTAIMEISAKSAVVLKIASGEAPREVYAKSPQESVTPASLTKLLAIITALGAASRFGLAMSTPLEVEASDVARGSGSNLMAGDRLSFQDSIANMLLPSSNMTANAVARIMGRLLLDARQTGQDPVSRFVEEMNTTARSLGMTASTFTNPHGLHSRAQVTTCSDIAKLLIETTRHRAIADFWGLPAYTLAIAGPNAREQGIRSSVKLVGHPGILGGKTGTVRNRTYNLAIHSQTSSGARLGLVIMQSSSDEARYDDMRILLDSLSRS